MKHPRIRVEPGTIRRIMNRTRGERIPMTTPAPPPVALPGSEIEEWSVDRGRLELLGILHRGAYRPPK